MGPKTYSETLRPVSHKSLASFQRLYGDPDSREGYTVMIDPEGRLVTVNYFRAEDDQVVEGEPNMGRAIIYCEDGGRITRLWELSNDA